MELTGLSEMPDTEKIDEHIKHVPTKRNRESAVEAFEAIKDLSDLEIRLLWTMLAQHRPHLFGQAQESDSRHDEL